MSILAKFSRLRRATRARYARWGNLTTLAVTIIPVSTYIGVGTPDHLYSCTLYPPAAGDGMRLVITYLHVLSYLP